ncbi:unnamed protein product, partial [Symbiodinium microadriaticum]
MIFSVASPKVRGAAAASGVSDDEAGFGGGAAAFAVSDFFTGIGFCFTAFASLALTAARGSLVADSSLGGGRGGGCRNAATLPRGLALAFSDTGVSGLALASSDAG